MCVCTCLFRTVQNYFCYANNKISVTDFLTQRGPSAESVTRPVELSANACQVRLPSVIAVLSVVRVYATLLFRNKLDSHNSDTDRTRKQFLLTQKIMCKLIVKGANSTTK